ncbi:claudin-1-like isoform X2 [Denticeps clupeoides]|uniref:Claudin n=1 Tax=Denticeps clupeoides TaxID=299321 RepID=A0AAY4EAB8_9TELE|nr:claudin-1-like isoform X2 [Denticeps clupeoides]
MTRLARHLPSPAGGAAARIPAPRSGTRPARLSPRGVSLPPGRMANAAVQLAAYALASLGLLCAITATCLNEWKTFGHSDGGVIQGQEITAGLWKECSKMSTGQVICEEFESILHQSVEIQMSRAVMIVSIVLSLSGVTVALVGMKCTTCMEDEKELKNKVATAGGVLFILGGICSLLIISWYAHSIVADFQDHHHHHEKFTLGRALFVGWGGALVSIVGGALLCCSSRRSGRTPTYYNPPSHKGGTEYV